MDKKPCISDIIYKVAVVAMLIDFSFALWKTADNIAALKH